MRECQRAVNWRKRAYSIGTMWAVWLIVYDPTIMAIEFHHTTHEVRLREYIPVTVGEHIRELNV